MVSLFRSLLTPTIHAPSSPLVGQDGALSLDAYLVILKSQTLPPARFKTRSKFCAGSLSFSQSCSTIRSRSGRICPLTFWIGTPTALAESETISAPPVNSL